MLLEDYFDFFSPDDIRIKGTRIGIETILYNFIHQCQTPEEIVQSYPTLTLEKVYATILYYLHNQEKISAYMTDWLEWSYKVREQQRLNPPPFIDKLRKLKAERDAMKKTNDTQISAG
ncbi:MAG: DUF433 domain-containing protein [Gomphosphaeria aponina SAG 52.96 = DSM 107014]|uniref:DUF433 domain-containing protein n=1 Tax=Gomphosphaeria aponina SAG 52.96 = DSM 107014 TaxID=1521640 RepID=A0A941JMT1_9CHRO|nr:DUF433 domain-containing protein [Gomphosphaeria aponina SAG 52.96 = DSM 107014]